MSLREKRRPRAEVLKEFDHIWGLHSQKVYRFALRVLGDPDEAEDIVQKTFISLYTTLLLKPINSPKTWLLRAAANHLRHCNRSQAKRGNRETSLDELIEDGIEPEAPPPTASREDFIAGLPDWVKDKDKEILALYYYDRLELREVATICGYTYGAIRVHLSKLLHAIRERETEHISMQ